MRQEYGDIDGLGFAFWGVWHLSEAQARVPYITQLVDIGVRRTASDQIVKLSWNIDLGSDGLGIAKVGSPITFVHDVIDDHRERYLHVTLLSEADCMMRGVVCWLIQDSTGSSSV